MSEIVEWIDADGVSLTLNSPSVTLYQVDWDVTGRFMPRIETQVDEIPGRAGALLRDTRHGIHEFVLPLSIAASSEANLRSVLRDLVDRMDPTRGVGKIRVTSPIGDQREINCVYAAGLEMAEREGVSGPEYQECPLAFTAHDPYWYDPSPAEQSFSVTDTPDFFPILPVRLTSSELVADGVATNSGSVDAWPVWTITGPGSSITLRNLTTSKFLTLDGVTLQAGESAVIDTRPGYRTVTQNDGTNLYPYLTLFSTLWPLARGANSVRLEMTGVDAAVSELTLSYYQRYLSP